MSKIILVGEHHVTVPEPIRGKSEILFSNEKDAYWRRELLIKEYRDIWFSFIPHHTKLYQQATLYDQDDILVSLNKEDSDYIIRIYEQEMTRRREGVFFKNGKEIEWITGDHYFALMHCKMQRHDGHGDYADFRTFQRDFYYLIHHVWSRDNILGLFLSKAKKTGITNMFWLYYLNRATMSKNKNFGYMNIEQGQAAKTFRDYFMVSYNGLVPALKPQWKNKSEVDGSIIFGQSYRNSKQSKLISNNSEDELNSSVFCVPTKDKAFDVAVMNDIAFDEPTKYKQNFGEIFRTNKEAVKIQSKINGRAWAFNYTPEDDTESFRQARKIFLESELKTILPNSNGQTKSGMISYHIPAYASWEGAFDKHGRCDEQKAIIQINFERSKVKGDKRALQAITRQYATNKMEAWGSAGAGSTFDNIRLSELLSDLEVNQHDSARNNYIEGNFEWEKPLWNIGLRNKRKKGEFTNVKFVPLTERQMEEGVKGKFRMYYDIHTDQKNLALKQGRDEWGCLLPPSRFNFIMGGDPTSYAAAGEVIEGSKNCAYVLSMPDEKLDLRLRKVASKIIHFEYYDRPELPDEAFEDFLMLIIYTGSLALIEGNASYVATRMMEEGLGHYMLIKDENGIITTWKRWMGLSIEKEKKYNLIKMTANSNNKEVLEGLVRVIKSYIERPTEGEKDFGRTIKSERLLQQLMDFDATDTRTADAAMAFGWTLFAMECYIDMLLYEFDESEDEQNIGAILMALSE